MKLPGGDRAVVDLAKLRDYCLNVDHPRGRHKARAFQTQLGLTRADAGNLRAALLSIARDSDAAVTGDADEFGQRYRLDFTFQGPAGRAVIRSGWIVRTGESFPRFTTCYVLEVQNE